jgi:MFS transporter, SP family, xylose:H+ symportor
VGINVVLYYATDNFKGMGLTTSVSLFQAIIVGAVNLIFTVVAIVTIDRFGRRPLQIIGALVMATSMMLQQRNCSRRSTKKSRGRPGLTFFF